VKLRLVLKSLIQKILSQVINAKMTSINSAVLRGEKMGKVKRKAVSGLVLMLLLTSILTLAFNIQPAMAEPPITASQEAPPTEWAQTYGGTKNDWGSSVVQTSDGGYAIAGYTEDYAGSVYAFWLVRTDSAGNHLWNRAFGSLSECAWSVVQASDGGYALAGYTYSYVAGSSDFWLVKTDSAGTMLWSRTYGGTSSEEAYSLIQTDDGGYALAGSSSHDFWLVKTDSAGNMQWNKTCGGTSTEEAYSVVQTDDGGYALAGYTYSYGAGGADFWLVKLGSAPPHADFVYYPVEPKAGQIVTFDASSSYDSDGRIVSYDWDWDGDGEYDDYSGTGPISTWQIENGTFNVGLRVVDNSGAEGALSKQIVVGQSAISRLSTMLAEWYESLDGSYGLGQNAFDTSRTDTTLVIWPWGQAHKRFTLIDKWLRELDTGSKTLCWLKGTKFACLEEVDLLYILNAEVDHETAPGFTYQTMALNAINEEMLVQEAWKQFTPDYNYVMKPLFQYAFGTVWSLSVSEQAILDLSLPLGIGISTIRSGLRALSIKNVMKSIEKTAYSQALAAYFRERYDRGEGSHDDAWNAVLHLANFAVPSSANAEERAAILENMKWYFGELWTKYEGDTYYDYQGLLNRGLPMHMRREYREQLKNILLDALERGSPFLPNSKKCKLRSPGELRVYDSEGRITGVVDGVEIEEIPNSVYDDETNTVTALFPSETLGNKVVGTATGLYGLTATSIENGQIVNFNATDIPISSAAIHQSTIDWVVLSQGGDGATVQIDSNGDGMFEYNFTSDSELSRVEYVAATTGHDLGITGISSSKRVIGEGYMLPINITVMNYGPYAETFNVTVYANLTLVSTQIATLANASSATVTCTWNTSGFVKGNYTISAYVIPVAGETWTIDNTYTGGTVKVVTPGDVNADGVVDIVDVSGISAHWYPGPPSGPLDYAPNFDINDDNNIDIIEVSIISAYWTGPPKGPLAP